MQYLPRISVKLMSKGWYIEHGEKRLSRFHVDSKISARYSICSGRSACDAWNPWKPLQYFLCLKEMSLFGTDAYESVLFVARECFVYRIPPRKTTAGYKAAEWGDMEAFLWKGRLRIIEKGEECSIRLEDKDSGDLFALCPYDITGQSVEPVLDSSRYFVLRVENEDPNGGAKKRAFIGMGFQDRSDSFDFNVALQDWTKRAKAAKAPAEEPGEDAPSPHMPSGPKQDYSLKEGQTFSIKIPGANAGRKIRDGNNSNSTSGPSLGGFGGALLPPPPSRRK